MTKQFSKQFPQTNGSSTVTYVPDYKQQHDSTHNTSSSKSTVAAYVRSHHIAPQRYNNNNTQHSDNRHRNTLSGVISRLPDAQAKRARHLLSRLKQELKKLGHDGFVREDSQLAISFISGRLDRQKWNLRSVATEIYKTTQLYTHTNFSHVSHEIVDHVTRACGEFLPPNHTEIVKRTAVLYLIPALKNVYMQLFTLLEEDDNVNKHINDTQAAQSCEPYMNEIDNNNTTYPSSVRLRQHGRTDLYTNNGRSGLLSTTTTSLEPHYDSEDDYTQQQQQLYNIVTKELEQQQKKTVEDHIKRMIHLTELSICHDDNHHEYTPNHNGQTTTANLVVNFDETDDEEDNDGGADVLPAEHHPNDDDSEDSSLSTSMAVADDDEDNDEYSMNDEERERDMRFERMLIEEYIDDGNASSEITRL